MLDVSSFLHDQNKNRMRFPLPSPVTEAFKLRILYYNLTPTGEVNVYRSNPNSQCPRLLVLNNWKYGYGKSLWVWKGRKKVCGQLSGAPRMKILTGWVLLFNVASYSRTAPQESPPGSSVPTLNSGEVGMDLFLRASRNFRSFASDKWATLDLSEKSDPLTKLSSATTAQQRSAFMFSVRFGYVQIATLSICP